ncbi:MAG: head-tail connector protein [Candidatus Pacearchaeota archaeon]|jgi:uncharacterized phiE125 gp8 family phage protein
MERAYSYHIITPPATTPVTLAEVKEHLKLDPTDTSQDTYLTFLIKAATKFGEDYTRRIFINTGFRTYRDFFECCIKLRRSKLQSLDLYEYLVDSLFTTVTSTLYYVTDEVDFSKIVLKNDQHYPIDIDEQLQAIKIEFTAGYGTSETDVPDDIRLALLNHLAAVYENKGDCDQASIMKLLPATSNAIYQMYRIYDLGVYSIAGECV